MSRQREIAYQVLCEALRGEKFANLAMQSDLKALPLRQRPFVTELVNGVLRRYYWLCYQFTDQLRKQTRLELRVLLAMAFYERLLLHEKEYALVNEYVSLASEKEKAFVNAILRRTKEERNPTGSDPDALSLRYSLPVWLIKMLQKQYNANDFAFILNDSQQEPKITYRRAPLRASKEEWEALGAVFEDDYIFYHPDNLINHEAFRSGKCYIQDRNAMRLVEMLDLQPDSIFLDMCSAPGAKLYNALEIVTEKNVYSNDVNAVREELLKKRAYQLGYRQVHYSSLDARLLPNQFNEKFTHILLDAPCSGLGVLKRKPDLRYRVKPENLDALQQLQAELLEAAVKMLQPGGILVYGTCTLNRKENDKQVQHFLQQHSTFDLLEEKLFLREEGDHFYGAKLRKGAV